MSSAPIQRSDFDGNSGYWKLPTVAGLFRIVPHSGRYRAMWENETFGIFTSPRRALNGLRSTPSLKFGPIAEDTRRMLPNDLRRWTFVQPRRAET